jgi:hypothetical protein
MSKDELKAAVEELRSALEHYKSQPNPGVGVFEVAETRYLQALGAAVLAIGDEIT